MIRSAKIYKVVFAKNSLDENGQLVSELVSAEVHEQNEKKAVSTLSKQLGYKVTPLQVTSRDVKYSMDDDFFFAHATIIEG